MLRLTPITLRSTFVTLAPLHRPRKPVVLLVNLGGFELDTVLLPRADRDRVAQDRV